jgi:hypothetical protein
MNWFVRGFGKVGGDGRWNQVVERVWVYGSLGGMEEGGMDSGVMGGPMTKEGCKSLGG